MSEEKRARRREDLARVKRRMKWILRRMYHHNESQCTGRAVGIMASTHGKPCSCGLSCGNRRRDEGPTLAERRADDGKHGK